MSNTQLLTAILLCAAVTYGLRLLPFMVFDPKRGIPPVITRLGNMLPSAVMAALVVYCLKDLRTLIPAGNLAGAFCLLAGTAATAAAHLWRRNTILSIFVGTAVYMVLLRVLGQV